MKLRILFFALASFINTVSAQDRTSLIVFNNASDKFRVFLNGKLQNKNFEKSVGMNYLPLNTNLIRVDFENPKLQSVTRKVFLRPNEENYYQIKPLKAGMMQLRPIAKTTYDYLKKNEVVYVNDVPQVENPNPRIVNDVPPTQGANPRGLNDIRTGLENPDKFEEGPNGKALDDKYYGNTNNTSTNCRVIMPNSNFLPAKKQIETKKFDETRLEVAKQITQANCLTSDQIKEIASLMTFESNRLTYAKFAYSYCADKRNYFKVNDVFTFESSTLELINYIKGK